MNLREIDRLVAEHVMGWEPVYDDGDLISFVTEFGILFFSDDDEREWSPTIDIADAWQVVEKLNEDDFDFQVWREKGKYNVEFSKDFFYLYGFAESETAPLAICLAALKAVGVEVEVIEQ
ncbi:BC1872 family protein [Thermaerobacillus caldiproteolyticus]|uniref:BC1872 family protein n=1 Tax=Thermaerobacillus caldiproteolyticus TaxID=247480 RepID=UPI0018F1CB04|nr:hypothetical protein [Anoxybacillus caldiproteolyticus]